MFALSYFFCYQECMQSDRDLIHSADTRAGFFYQKSRMQHTGIEIRRKIARTLE